MFDKALKNLDVTVFDYGTFTYLIQSLVGLVKKARYYTPYKGSFPTAEKAMIGEGIDGVENISPRTGDDFWDIIRQKKTDWVIFPDVGDGDMQEMIRSLGIPVTGMGKSEILEMNRYFFKKKLEEVGLPVSKYKRIIGIEALRKAFKNPEYENWIAKLSYYRGLMETFKLKDYNHAKSRLNFLAHNAGAFASQIEVILEECVDGVEFGTDWAISKFGWADKGTYGCEIKNKGYICKVMEYNKLPTPVKLVHDKIGPYLTQNGAGGMMSTEIIITPELKPYWIDATMRQGSPPGEIQCGGLWKNFPKMMFAAAMGHKVIAEESHKFAAHVMLKSDWAKRESIAIDFPKEMADKLKFRNLYVEDNQYYYIPQQEGDIIGAAIGFGRTLEEAEDEALEAAESVEADSLEYDESVFDKADEKIKEAQVIGLGKF